MPAFLDPNWPETFLEALRKSPNIAAACRKADVSRQTAYERRKVDSGFATAWHDALEESTDELVGEAYRRAFESSDTLTIFLLKKHRPDIYGDRISLDAQVTTRNVESSRTELTAVIAALCERRGTEEDPPGTGE